MNPKGYIADFPDLADCSAFGDSPVEALREAIKAKKVWIEAAKSKNKLALVLTKDTLMDYFENIVKKLLEQEGKWVRQSVKVDITLAEKKRIGKRTMPRPEIDLVSYHPKSNTIEFWEVKSFMDSTGVKSEHICMENPKGRYKLLTCKKYQKIVISRLVTDWSESGLIFKDPKIIVGLAVGKF